MKQAEVAVVGAGPAGCATAFFLARQGIDVLLLDRSGFPRAKTCGDGLSPPAVALLGAMGLADLAAQGYPVYHTRVHAPGGGALECSSSAPGVSIARRDLDARLLEQATGAGARFRPQTTFLARRLERGRVVVDTDAGAVHARCLVLATGSHPAPLRALGAPRRVARPGAFGVRAYFEGVDYPEQRIVLSYDRALLPAYGWVFPMGGGRANVGVCLYAGHTRRNAAELFRRFVASAPPVRSILAKARQATPLAGAPLRVAYRDGNWMDARTWIVGEAFCGVNPLSGEGIYAALLSGRLAAEALGPALRGGGPGPEALRAYRAAAWEALGRRFRRAAWISRCFRVPFFLDRLIGCARGSPKLADIASYAAVGDANPLTGVSVARLVRLLVTPKRG